MPGGSAVTRPMMAASAPCGCARSAVSAACAQSLSTTATNLPSQATYIGSMPSSSEAPRTSCRTGISSSLTRTPTSAATPISFRIVATPARGGPHAGGGGEQIGHDPVQPGGVGLDIGLDVEFAPGQHDGDAVVADRPRYQDGVTRPGLRDTEAALVLDHADARGVDVAAVCLAALHHLGVPGDDLNAGPLRGRLHRGDDLLQVGDGEALFEDEPGGQVERHRAGHRQVVHRAVDSKVADVAAGEEQR